MDKRSFWFSRKTAKEHIILNRIKKESSYINIIESLDLMQLFGLSHSEANKLLIKYLIFKDKNLINDYEEIFDPTLIFNAVNTQLVKLDKWIELSIGLEKEKLTLKMKETIDLLISLVNKFNKA